MDRAELIAKSWENEFMWSSTIGKSHDNLQAIAQRVLRAVEEVNTDDIRGEAAINKAVLMCCGVEEKDPEQEAKVPPEKMPSRDTQTRSIG